MARLFAVPALFAVLSTAFAADVTSPPTPVTIAAEPLVLAPGTPLSQRALVNRPAPLKNLRSWTLETTHHRGYLMAQTISPDGKRFATGGLDGIIRVWDAESGQMLRALVGHHSYVTGLAWSPDGNTLASAGSYDYTARLWDARSGQLLRTFKGFKGYVSHVAWSPDGRTLAVAGGESGYLSFFDVTRGRLARTVEQGQPLYAIAWSPDGKRVLSGARLVSASIWEVETGKSEATVKHDGDDVYAVAWSPDGKSLALGGKTTTAIRDATGEKVLHSLTGQGYYVAWSPDGKTLASAPASGVVQLWDAATGKAGKPMGSGVRALFWSPDGALYSTTYTEVTRWDLAMAKAAKTIPAAIYVPLAWSPGKPFLSGVGGRVAVWDAATGKRLHAPEDFTASGAAWSRDGKVLACACPDKAVRLLDVASGKATKLDSHTAAVTAVAWSPDGKLLATAGADKTVRLWSTATEKILRTLEGHDNSVTALAWSRDSRILASGGADRVVCLWNADQGKLLRTIKDMPPVYSLTWSPDGKMVAVGGDDDFIRICSAANGQVVGSLERGGSPRTVTALAYSPDGAVLASARGNHTMQGWSVKTGKVLHDLQALAPVQTVAWSTGGTTVATGNTAGVVRFWDVATGQPRAALALCRDGVAAVSAEGQCRLPPEGEAEVVGVVQLDKGQETVTLKELGTRYGWRNTPTAVRLAGN